MEEFFNQLIEKYSENKYDFRPGSVSCDEAESIKKLAREKRYQYGIAPIGVNIFKFIRDNEKDIFFEKDKYNTDFDALIYLPDSKTSLAFIILNENKPLVNQIFAAAHEYYHYIKDIEELKREPMLCALSDNSHKREQMANRFAAEFLLPDDALKNEIKVFTNSTKCDINNLDNNHFAALCYMLFINYALPLKAIIYRLHEEGYLKNNIKKYLDNYEFLKKCFSEISRKLTKRAQELISSENSYIEEVMYDYIPKAFEKGYVSLELLKKELKDLNLEICNFDIYEEDYTDDDNEEDEEFIERLRKITL